jgi:AraC-like DNA-binding protein
MIFHQHIPKFPLDNYVEKIIYVEGNNKGAGLPKTAMSVVFNLQDSFKLFHDSDFSTFTDYRRHWVAGLQTQPRYVESYGQSKMIVIQFKTLGAFVFLNQPLLNFTDDYVPLEHIFGNEADETWEQLCESQTFSERILITENFLFRKLLSQRLPNQKLLHSINSLLNIDEKLSISQICKEHNISRKHLNHLFKEYTGVSPKMLSSLHRFQRILKKISSQKPEKLTDLAYELEYFDQAHFNNDFKRFSRLNPSEYLKLVEENPALKMVPHFLPVM